VELIYSEKSVKYDGKGISLGFKVPDLEAALGEVKAKGVDGIKGPFKVGGGTQFFYIKDPDGVDIQIVQPGF
jgi:predicted enzyme related to lactoylglutathione lyase